jgi:D-alanine-D-alanine ligase
MTGKALAQAHVVILQGGPSPEAEVSRSSAAGLEQALLGLARQLTRLEVDRDLASNLLALAPDVVFPALHGPPGEDGTVQGLLDLLGLPYVGSGVAASVTAMDKTLAKHGFRAAGLPVARDVVVPRGTGPADASAMVQSSLGTQVVVKPSQQGSALGVTLVDNAESLEAALELALGFGDAVLVEERLQGRELTAAIFAPAQQDAVALPLIEIVTPAHSWYDFEHRYAPGASEHLVPAPVSDAEAEAMKRIALTAHRCLGCRDLSRADLILTQAGPVLLEVNTLPGMTPTSLYPDAAKAAGLPFPQLARSLVQSALSRGPRFP